MKKEGERNMFHHIHRAVAEFRYRYHTNGGTKGGGTLWVIRECRSAEKHCSQFAIVITTSSFIGSSVSQFDWSVSLGLHWHRVMHDLPRFSSLVKYNGSLERQTEGDREGEKKTVSKESDEDDLNYTLSDANGCLICVCMLVWRHLIICLSVHECVRPLREFMQACVSARV